MSRPQIITRFMTTGALLAAGTLAHAHGDVAPQAVDTSGLPEVGEEWLTENPYRVEQAGEEVWLRAIEIGASGYTQNCARCHGLEVVSGGLAPDLRYLEAEEYGDEWFIERFRTGYTQNGITKMPAFGELLGQEAAWAIRTYVEARPDDGAIDDFSHELKTMRDQFGAYAKSTDGADADAIKQRLMEIAESIETGSGAPVADSVALRAARAIDGSAQAYETAAEILTIGLSAAN